MKRRILVLLGTRPEAIKLSPLVLELRRRELFSVELASTGQHRRMLREALVAFSLCPDHDLDLMQAGECVTVLLGRMLGAVDGLLEARAPAAVVVQGDTLSAYAGALAAFYRGIPVAHVEAGLRTGHMRSPFPEEMHRTAISYLTTLHFAPTVRARKNLLAEGRPERQVFVTGNTVVDALRYTLARPMPEEVRGWLPSKGRRLLLFTAHRREHWGETLRGMFRALLRIVRANPDVEAICPLHPNPQVREAAAILTGEERIRVIEPPDVLQFHHLLSRAYLILTDSGGIQEEAVSLGIPTVVMRYSTERSEGLRSGVLRLSGSGEEGIVSLTNDLLSPSSVLYGEMKKPSRIFGDGRASVRIADLLERNL